MENLPPSIIYVYAVDSLKTEESHVTAQGFGHSTPLENPVNETQYHWEGKLHGSRQDIISSSNTNSSLSKLVQNLVLNLKQHPSLTHNKARKPAYRISHDVSSRFKGNAEDTPRKLNPTEEVWFDGDFSRYMRAE